MTYFEFREWIESCFPWWGPFAIPAVALAFMAVRWTFLFVVLAMRK